MSIWAWICRELCSTRLCTGSPRVGQITPLCEHPRAHYISKHFLIACRCGVLIVTGLSWGHLLLLCHTEPPVLSFTSAWCSCGNCVNTQKCERTALRNPAVCLVPSALRSSGHRKTGVICVDLRPAFICFKLVQFMQWRRWRAVVESFGFGEKRKGRTITALFINKRDK